MSQNSEFDPASVAIKPAATVMLLRETSDVGVEVFMMRRTTKAAFAGGMYVFPGGAVDAEDSSYEIAAIRECFEEAGVLLARSTKTNQLIAFDEDEIIQRFDQARLNVHDSVLSIIDLCRLEDLRLVTDSIQYVSHWITPVGEARRFDTRFFVARAPASQEPLHDSQETIASLWVQPQHALDQLARGELAMFPPTSENLKFLAKYKTSAEVLTAAKKVSNPLFLGPDRI